MDLVITLPALPIGLLVPVAVIACAAVATLATRYLW